MEDGWTRVKGAEGKSTINTLGVDGITKTTTKSIPKIGRDRLASTIDGAKGVDILTKIAIESTLETRIVESRDEPTAKVGETIVLATTIGETCGIAKNPPSKYLEKKHHI